MTARRLPILLALLGLATTCDRRAERQQPPTRDRLRAERPATPGTVPGAPPAGRAAPLPATGLPTPAPLALPDARARYAAYAAPQAGFAQLRSPEARQAALLYPKTEEPAGRRPPISLTASDGTGLRLVALTGKAVVQGPLAFTELHLTFENPQARTLEGRFEITLPQEAAISRFAMKVGDRWQEAEVVERQRARVIYEDFLHRRQDPALLEKKAGNAFRARIFPIPARGRKEVIVSYSHELASAETPYRLPLKGLPRIDALELMALVGTTASKQVASSLGGQTLTHQVVRVQKTQFVPDQDFVVQPVAALAGLRHGNLVVARVRPKLKDTAAPVKSLLVLFDTSASRAAGFFRQVALLGELVAALRRTHGEAFRLQVIGFDQVLGPVYDGPASGFGKAQLDGILSRRALGASDLHGALVWAGTQRGFHRLLLITDGIRTAGNTESDRIRLAAAALKPTFSRLDVIAVGGIRDDALLGRLARGTLATDGAVLDGATPVAALARRLGRSTTSHLPVTVAGAGWVWPTRLDGVQPGDEVLVYADLPEGALPPGQPLEVQLGAAGTVRVPLQVAPRPLLERAWVKARMARIEHQMDTLGAGDGDLRSALRQQILKLSKGHRVLCDETALLVLETEWDYRRYGIDRTAGADILTVGTSGVEVVQRATPAPDPLAGNRPIRILRGRPDRSGAPAAMSAPAMSAPSRGGSSLQDLLRQAGGAPAEPKTARGPAGSMASRAPMGAPGRASGGSNGFSMPMGAARMRRRPAAAMRAAALEGLFGDDDSAAKAPPRSERSQRVRTHRTGRPRVFKSRTRRPPTLDEPPPVQRPPRADGRPVARVAPYSGRFAEIMAQLGRKQVNPALVAALKWRSDAPGNVLALVALGEALEAAGERAVAARVYGSLIDLFPSRADLRRFAGQRLERLGKEGWALAADTFSKAAALRPDHPGSHRLLAWSLVKLGEYAAAFEALVRAGKQRYRQGSFAGVAQVLAEDLELVGTAWIRAEPARKAEILERLRRHGLEPDRRPSLRFVLYWETDANDVDFHIHDGRGGHAYYQHPTLRSGGKLYADVTTGYGPECFTIRGAPGAYPYTLKIHYFSRGPMGYGMGKVEALWHDGQGRLAFKQLPYVVMTDGAFLELGRVTRLMFR